MFEDYGVIVIVYGVVKFVLVVLCVVLGNLWFDVFVFDIVLGEDEDGYVLLCNVCMLESECDMLFDVCLFVVVLFGYDRVEDCMCVLLVGF